MKVIDSHIHLLALDNQHTLKWHGDHPLNKQNRLDEYTKSFKNVEIDGIIMIEFDPAVDMTSLDGCQNAIEEYEYISRIIDGKLKASEGLNEYSSLIKGVIPWAPMPMGREFLSQYVERLQKVGLQKSNSLVTGFRFLVQDKPPKTMTQKSFIESLKWLDEHNYVFDWGIDLHSGGLWQFSESIEVFRQVPNVKYIINHLTKPSYNINDLPEWKKYMQTIYELTPNSYMKLSGGFSELAIEGKQDVENVVDLIYPWFKVSWDLWGIERTIWASNWPVCEIGKPGVVDAWFEVTEKLFDKIGLGDERQKVYNTNYKQAYNLT